jgi:hypothetical protein
MDRAQKVLRSETAPGVFSKKLAFTPFAVAHYCRVTARERIQTLAINAPMRAFTFMRSEPPSLPRPPVSRPTHGMLHLQPIRRAPRAIRRVLPLRHDFEPPRPPAVPARALARAGRYPLKAGLANAPSGFPGGSRAQRLGSGGGRKGPSLLTPIEPPHAG